MPSPLPNSYNALNASPGYDALTMAGFLANTGMDKIFLYVNLTLRASPPLYTHY